MADTVSLWIGGKKHELIIDDTLKDDQIKVNTAEFNRIVEFEKNRRK